MSHVADTTTDTIYPPGISGLGCAWDDGRDTYGGYCYRPDDLEIGSRERAMQLFPASAELFQRKKDDGRSDASLIAKYGATQGEHL